MKKVKLLLFLVLTFLLCNSNITVINGENYNNLIETAPLTKEYINISKDEEVTPPIIRAEKENTLINDINTLLEDKLLTEESLNNLKQQALHEKKLVSKEEFDIFGGFTNAQEIKNISSKQHREKRREKYSILGITQDTTLEEYVEKVGVGNAFVDYFLKLSKHVKKYDKIPMIWGDVLLKHPEAIKRLPEDTIFIDWGYNVDYPYHENLKMLHEMGVKFMSAPATSTWGVITSRYLEMIKDNTLLIQ